jgi:predicted metalloprotease with PDZ domain
MTKFLVQIPNPSSQYINIKVEFDVKDDLTDVFLPTWRPGRYELGYFAKYIRNFKCTNENNENLSSEKVAHSHWKVITKNSKKLVVSYQFYANILNAGSTYLDDQQLYVNPVNCCVFTDEALNKKVELELNVPSSWEKAVPLPLSGNTMKAENFDQLFDSPFIVSSQLQHRVYHSNDTAFYVWFNGEVKPDWDRLLNHFQAFTDKQIEKFAEFPVKEYHFLFQILNYKAYHGVEHTNCTVISLGPGYDVFESLYKELLGVSSHELYHTWNVKTIRPADMYPYDFKKENYSNMGFLAEGVTTYQGDLFLFKSGVFNHEAYLNELTNQFQKHFDNPGRFSYSVRESSFDTWLDGYELGAPGRKVSIYTEGCLLALVTDVFIMRESNLKYGLDDLMKRLYFNFALNGKGVTETDYLEAIKSLTGTSFEDIFETYFSGTSPFESILVETLDYIGLDLQHKPSSVYSEARLGLKFTENGSSLVRAMYPGSPAELSGLMLNDAIKAVNGCAVNNDLNKWLKHFNDDHKELIVDRAGRILTITLPEVNRNFYMKYSVVKKETLSNQQQRAFEKWSS